MSFSPSSRFSPKRSLEEKLADYQRVNRRCDYLKQVRERSYQEALGNSSKKSKRESNQKTPSPNKGKERKSSLKRLSPTYDNTSEKQRDTTILPVDSLGDVGDSPSLRFIKRWQVNLDNETIATSTMTKASVDNIPSPRGSNSHSVLETPKKSSPESKIAYSGQTPPSFDIRPDFSSDYDDDSHQSYNTKSRTETMEESIDANPQQKYTETPRKKKWSKHSESSEPHDLNLNELTSDTDKESFNIDNSEISKGNAEASNLDLNDISINNGDSHSEQTSQNSNYYEQRSQNSNTDEPSFNFSESFSDSANEHEMRNKSNHNISSEKSQSYQQEGKQTNSSNANSENLEEEDLDFQSHEAKPDNSHSTKPEERSKTASEIDITADEIDMVLSSENNSDNIYQKDNKSKRTNEEEVHTAETISDGDLHFSDLEESEEEESEKSASSKKVPLLDNIFKGFASNLSKQGKLIEERLKAIHLEDGFAEVGDIVELNKHPIHVEYVDPETIEPDVQSDDELLNDLHNAPCTPTNAQNVFISDNENNSESDNENQSSDSIDNSNMSF